MPSAGGYRLFLDFQHGGVVRTAEFTARVDARHVAAAGSSHEQLDRHARPSVELAIGGHDLRLLRHPDREKLNKLDGVTATVNYATEKAHGRLPRRASTPDDLVATVEQTGYTATLPAAPSDRPTPTPSRTTRPRGAAAPADRLAPC